MRLNRTLAAYLVAETLAVKAAAAVGGVALLVTGSAWRGSALLGWCLLDVAAKMLAAHRLSRGNYAGNS